MSSPIVDHSQWRLVITQPADGASNMAIDQAIGEAVAAGDVLPTLRFYRWNPPCVSLGQSQSAELLDLNRCAHLGWDIVRRTTGGRAVLHHDELTYSIAAPLNEPRVAGGVLKSYQRLSLGLLTGLQLMGATPQRATSDKPVLSQQSAACFEIASDYELTIDGRKLIGSAQKRSRNLVLQHGSIPLSGDIAQLVAGLQLTSNKRAALQTQLRSQATTFAQVLGRRVDSAELIPHLTQGFATALNIKFITTPLSQHEQTRAVQIRAEKFANMAWTYRR